MFGLQIGFLEPIAAIAFDGRRNMPFLLQIWNHLLGQELLGRKDAWHFLDPKVPSDVAHVVFREKAICFVHGGDLSDTTKLSFPNKTYLCLMAKAILEFDLTDPDDYQMHIRAVNATNAYMALGKMDEWLRGRIKYVDGDKHPSLEEMREHLQ